MHLFLFGRRGIVFLACPNLPPIFLGGRVVPLRVIWSIRAVVMDTVRNGIERQHGNLLSQKGVSRPMGTHGPPE